MWVFLPGLCMSEDPGPPVNVNVFMLDLAQVSFKYCFSPRSVAKLSWSSTQTELFRFLRYHWSSRREVTQHGGQKLQKMSLIHFEILSAWLPFLLSLLPRLRPSSCPPVSADSLSMLVQRPRVSPGPGWLHCDRYIWPHPMWSQHGPGGDVRWGWVPLDFKSLSSRDISLKTL